MNITKNILPVTTVKKKLMSLLSEIQDGNEPIVITKDGLAAGVLLSAADYENMVETIEVLSDEELMLSIRKALKSKKRFSHDEVFGK